MKRKPTIFLVDDDEDMLRSLQRLLEAADLSVAAYQSAQAFLDDIDTSAPGCLVLDLSMPQVGGLDLQLLLAEKGSHLPIIFLTGKGDIRTSVQAMKFGAVDFLTKPVEDEELLRAIHRAVERNDALRQQSDEQAEITARFARLTARESEVLMLVVAGRLNKQIAAQLGIVEKTVKVHRASIMSKVGVRSVAELARLTERIDLKSQRS